MFFLLWNVFLILDDSAWKKRLPPMSYLYLGSCFWGIWLLQKLNPWRKFNFCARHTLWLSSVKRHLRTEAGKWCCQPETVNVILDNTSSKVGLLYLFWLDEEKCCKLASVETWQIKYYSVSQVVETIMMLWSLVLQRTEFNLGEMIWQVVLFKFC